MWDYTSMLIGISLDFITCKMLSQIHVLLTRIVNIVDLGILGFIFLDNSILLFNSFMI